MSKKAGNEKKRSIVANPAKYPRHSLAKVLRIPKAILEQNAGRDCTDRDSAAFVGVGFNGPYKSEIGSAKKYGLLESPQPARLQVSELAKKILRPKTSSDEIEGLRQAATNAPDIGEVYRHYRGENIPDVKFFENTLVDQFGIPREKVDEFKEIFFETLATAQLIEDAGGKQRVLDVLHEHGGVTQSPSVAKRATPNVKVEATDSCFVMMPFKEPLGSHYSLIFEKAITKAGLKAVRADDDIFGTGKIVDQVWRGIRQAKVLVAELTDRNPNVFYELGLAHALQKPVVLVSSNENDVPFDLKQIRVIYYNVHDPFWGEKLIEKVSENILSALSNPEEAIFKYPES